MMTLFSFLKPYRLSCFFIVLIVLADVGGSLLIPAITANMINLAVSGKGLDRILHLGVMMLAIAVASGTLTLLGSWLSARLSANVGRDMRNAIYDRSLQFSSSDFETFGTASMLTRTLNDVGVIQQGLTDFVQMLLPVPVVCILGTLFAFRTNSTMGALVCGVTVFVLIMVAFIMKKSSPIFACLQQYLDKMNRTLRENLAGVRVIRAFNKEASETRRMKKTFENYANASIQANYLFAGIDCLSLTLINLCLVAILYLGGNSIGLGHMKIGDLTAISEYTIWILAYVMMAQMTLLMLPRALTCLHRISAVLRHNPEITDGPIERIAAQGTEVLSFDNVSFRFTGAGADTLSRLSFTCRRGQTTAIIGGTGSGKSTLAQLALRFHDVTGGAVTLFGQDIRRLSQDVLRQAIAYVPQKAWLFSGTLAENLRYGNPQASDAALRHALQTAQAAFVEDLPQGLYTPVAQGGANFSGGQKQRLAIARALVKKAHLYLFDDSFSALDFTTDAALRRALSTELKGAAVLIIAQRISSIAHADQIIVLADGKIVGQGRHEKLLQTCPTYQDIVRSQQKGDISHD